ncbi:hypothetical protein [Plantactinospora sp. B5E13]|uniref:hypothetical protein n=1 Tax=unclassified Plantactinospora TaxID=2631981 RepID=UPI00325EF2D2
MSRLPHWILVAVAVAIPVLGVAACGSDGETAPQATASAANPDDQRLAYVRCMRENGVDMPEDENATGFPKPAGGEAAMRAAEEACRPFAPPKIGGAANDPAAQDRLIQLARCLRERGIEVPDPQPGEGLRMPPGSADSERAKQAIAECSKSGKTG